MLLRKYSALALLQLCLFPAFAYAGGVVHGAKAAGMGTAFTALVDDPSAILFNPAGLILSPGSQYYLGVTALSIETAYESPTGEKEDTDFEVFFPPHGYLSSDLGTANLAFGLGLHSPFGIGGRSWDREGLTRLQSTEHTIATYAINPTLAWRVHPNLSIGGGLNYMRVKMEMERMLDQSMVGAEEAFSSVDVTGGGWGYNAGLLFCPGDKVRFGFAYRSSIEVDSEGDFKVENIAPALLPMFGASRFETDVSSTDTFPEIYSLGIAFFPCPRLTVALDADLVKWSSFEKIQLDIENEVPAAGLTDVSEILDWQDSWAYKVGFQYRANERWSLRAGYTFIENYVPERTLGPGTPEADQHNFSLGFGYSPGSFKLDAFAAYGIYRSRTVDNEILDGTYDSSSYYAGVSLGYGF